MASRGSSTSASSKPSKTTKPWEENYKIKEITPAEWEERREIFTQLYFEGGNRLDEVRRIMATQHGFYANDTQCKKKIKKWELGKSLNRGAACAMLRIQKRRHEEGKETQFTYKGRIVTQEKLERSRRRLKDWDKEDETNPETPMWVGYSTPKSTADDLPEEDSQSITPGSGFSNSEGGDTTPYPVSSPETISESGTIENQMHSLGVPMDPNLDSSLDPFLQSASGRFSFSEPFQHRYTRPVTSGESSNSLMNLSDIHQGAPSDPYEFQRVPQMVFPNDQGSYSLDPNAITTLLSASLIYLDKGLLKVAEDLQRLAFDNLKEKNGERHPDTLASMQTLGFLCRDQGRYKEAEEILHRNLALSTGICEVHRYWMKPTQGLGVIYIHQGRLKEAEEYISRVTKASRETFGPTHPETLSAIHSLATVYMEMGKCKEAEQLLAGESGVLQMSKNQSGDQHPETLATMRTLATAYLNQGYLKKAEGMLQLVLTRSEQFLGRRHRQTISSMHCLGVAYLDLKRWKEAEQMLSQVLELSKQYLGDEHRHTLTAMHNLGVTYLDQGKLDLAETQFTDVVQLSSRHMGENHPDTLSSRNKLAKTYLKRGRWNDAELISKEVVSKSKDVLGETHPDVFQYSALLVTINQERDRATYL
ncbi:TPR-like protein [Choiromyces venosus 120613-1]|uniref:TPR-like protein n=1 Tax=Choiromyces venosus 120613-1 TaxID=1336337 RepID=A0A3N4JJS8_9PEZI|nr:TPR-like protein [Choiromyces venosus 120613-1]